MADLEPLLRYRKYQLDEKQKFLAGLYTLADALLAKRIEILDSIEAEKDALRSPEFEGYMAVSGFGHFLQGAKIKLKGVQNEESKLDTRIRIAQNDMRESFSDFKKIEITHERRLDEERKALQKREDALFEEIGLQIFSKNQE